MLLRDLLPLIFVLVLSRFNRAEVLYSDCRREGIFVRKKDHALIGFVLETRSVTSSLDCADLCLARAQCVSYNHGTPGGIPKCELNSESAISKPADLRLSPAMNHYGTEQICLNGGIVDHACVENELRCICLPEWTGSDCGLARLGYIESRPGSSCSHIKSEGDSRGDTSYWIQPPGASSPFSVFCHMSLVGTGWMKVPKAWLHSTVKGGVQITTSESNGGLSIAGSVTSYGCGNPGSGAVAFIKDYWTKIRYTQEFYGIVSCWRIFADNHYNSNHGGVAGITNVGVFPYNATEGDTIANQLYMAGSHGHIFKGDNTVCTNNAGNMWRDSVSGGTRRATITLRRDPTVPLAGILAAGTSCGTPSYLIRDIYVYF
ncbi:uncharacterized protein LOC116618527 [Nematostella vectensis]|uniref:uncharacterized protein LOC116618527 n=1 Tax=Nematostella vectensis TaxID=45351 RepID=UPI00138FB672|nr:uncharacterized protein LOC116618527 [Nematostella vectensis]